MEIPGTRRGLFLLAGGVVCLVLAGLLVSLFSGRWDSRPSGQVAGPAPHSVTEASPSKDALNPDQRGEDVLQEGWVIYITGAVMRPGVYRLPGGTRVYQAVEQAGGLSSEADPEAFNMALPLFDGIHVHVPRKVDAPGPPPAYQGGGSQGQPVGLIDINKAGAAALESLPGIGPKLAGEIIRHREERGRFSSVEDLLSVKGIGEKKLSAIRDLVTVSP
ncbi:MAG TPA: helix-hairpin-helix domain-containing protein [Synergistales bacterium]|nr:helix-hairpin-helix domain-containing protein [Synergistales bacterium]HRS48212.1 helix-hairpin-helix domain-containing protein [Thermovirgaceae bacterium]HRU90594.1 helix-hairpin-helix domain-containing protein [Thermovirgaceae bacterium]